MNLELSYTLIINTLTNHSSESHNHLQISIKARLFLRKSQYLPNPSHHKEAHSNCTSKWTKAVVSLHESFELLSLNVIIELHKCTHFCVCAHFWKSKTKCRIVDIVFVLMMWENIFAVVVFLYKSWIVIIQFKISYILIT